MSRPAPALVTGGTGHLGTHLVRALREAGRPVRTCGRRPPPEDLPPDVDYRQVDVAAPDGADALVQGCEVVFHTAGASSSTSAGEEMDLVNVLGTRRLAEAAYDAGVRRFVHISTSSVYGKKVPLPQPVVEDAPCHPDPGYAESKWRGEQALWEVADKGLPVVVLRPATIFGPGAVKLVASAILDAAIERYDGRRTFDLPREPVEMRLVHIDDVVAACLHLAASEEVAGRAFNLVSGAYPSSHEVGAAIADALGLELRLRDDADPGLSYERRMAVHDRMLASGMRDRILLSRERIRFLRKANRNNRLSIEALAASGFRPRVTDVAAAIRASVAWYRTQGWIL